MNLKVWATLGIGIGLLTATAFAVPPGTTEEIRTRLQPFGEVCRAGDECGQASAAAASGPLSGEEVYNKFCFACHATGASGAPMFGDSAAWSPRIAQGFETLLNHTLNGINMMPARGTCATCSDEELEAAMHYMAEGAK